MIHYHAVLPAENPAKSGQSLNILLVTENPAEREVRQVVRIYGSLGSGWRELIAEEREFPAHSHLHLYFNIPADRLSEDFWGEEVEELAITAGDVLPGPETQGVLVFFEGDLS